jgi:predicted nucleic acid-binding protein
MQPYFDSTLVNKLDSNLVLDTSVLSFCMSDPAHFKFIVDLTCKSELLIDPVAKLEFLRGAYQEHVLKERLVFLAFERFKNMQDHYKVHHDTADRALLVSRVYTHNGKSDIPLGDLLIISRLSLYRETMMLATFDKNDFNSILFDRIGIVTIERYTKDKKDTFSILQLLKFNQKKFSDCCDKLPS